MDEEVLVSIVIPAYNAARWLPETIASALAECDGDAEVIVVDDGSADETPDLLARFGRQIRPIRTANRGVSAARATGTKAARGRYIKYLDSDDLLCPGSLARQLELAETSTTDVIYGDWQRLRRVGRDDFARGEIIARRWQDVAPDPEVAFFTTMWCPTASYLWRASFLRDRHPGWHIGLPVIQDARFAFDAARAGARFLHEASVGVLYRVHEADSVSTRSRLAFLRDCQRNALEIEALWTGKGELSRPRHAALLSVWGSLTRGASRVDGGLFRECWAHFRGLDPRANPTGSPAFDAIARVVGYRAAEALSLRLATLRVRRRAFASSRGTPG